MAPVIEVALEQPGGPGGGRRGPDQPGGSGDRRGPGSQRTGSPRSPKAAGAGHLVRPWSRPTRPRKPAHRRPRPWRWTTANRSGLAAHLAPTLTGIGKRQRRRNLNTPPLNSPRHQPGIFTSPTNPYQPHKLTHSQPNPIRRHLQSFEFRSQNSRGILINHHRFEHARQSRQAKSHQQNTQSTAAHPTPPTKHGHRPNPEIRKHAAHRQLIHPGTFL